MNNILSTDIERTGYQIQTKREYASLCVLPEHTFYFLPYVEYDVIDKKIQLFYKAAAKYYQTGKLDGIIPENNSIVNNHVWIAYKQYCKIKNIKTVLDELHAKYSQIQG